MRLLVYTPTYNGGPVAECRASVLAQDYSGEWEWIIDTDDPFPTPDHRNVLAKFRRARQMALDGGHDALVTVEHDMIVPHDALTQFVKANEQVAYGVYKLRHGLRILNAWRANANTGKPMHPPPQFQRLIDDASEIMWPMSGCGWGCTFIRRDVLERITFTDSGENEAGDLAFSFDCLRNKVRAFAHFGVICGHIDLDNGVTLWPFDLAVNHGD